MASCIKLIGENKAKQVAAARNPDASGWISDEESRKRFLYNLAKAMALPYHLSLKKIKKEVFYHNLVFEDGGMKSRMKGVDIVIDDFIRMLFTRLEAEGAYSHLSNSEHNMSLKKNDLYSCWLRLPEGVPMKRQYCHEGLKRTRRSLRTFSHGSYYLEELLTTE
ncbi:hypothetical protein V8G54_007396 [Vigna mungo]|uniref:Uncharacterized protein n=1 Tax=Vigna mungo TaxID=3915 RepID=A0AAQ3S913_VIGMU